MNTFPLSPLRQAGNLCFLSGQIGVVEGILVSENFEDQLIQALTNLETILVQKELSMDSVIDVTAFLTSESDYTLFNKLYARYFKAPFPARAVVFVRALPLGARVELKAIASS